MQIFDQIFPGQQDIFWREWRLNPHSTAYNITLAYEIKGPLEEKRLINSIFRLIRSHEILRTVFSKKDESVYAQLLDCPNTCVDLIDVSGNRNPKREAVLTIEQIRKYIFDLENKPLYKFALIKVAEHHYFLILCFHHIVVDGLSEQYIIDFISATYNQRSIPNHALSLDGYLNTKNKLASLTENLAAHQFWQEQMKNLASDGNDFSAMKAMQDNNKRKGHYIYFNLDAQLTENLKILIESHKSSWFCLLMSAYLVTLYRLSDCNQLTVCYAANCRPKELDQAIGCFINILPFSLALEDSMALSEVLNAVTQLRSQQKAHQEYPFLEIVKSLRQIQETDIQSLLNIGLMQTHID